MLHGAGFLHKWVQQLLKSICCSLHLYPSSSLNSRSQAVQTRGRNKLFGLELLIKSRAVVCSPKLLVTSPGVELNPQLRRFYFQFLLLVCQILLTWDILFNFCGQSFRETIPIFLHPKKKWKNISETKHRNRCSPHHHPVSSVCWYDAGCSHSLVQKPVPVLCLLQG